MGWFEKQQRGRYHLVKTVQGYVTYLRHAALVARARRRR
jgi:hypothetical protein